MKPPNVGTKSLGCRGRPYERHRTEGMRELALVPCGVLQALGTCDYR